MIDYSFLVDVALNFRTTFVGRDDVEVVDGCRIAAVYARGWFLPDLVSSLPWDHIADGLASLRAVKLLKLARVLKVLP